MKESECPSTYRVLALYRVGAAGDARYAFKFELQLHKQFEVYMVIPSGYDDSFIIKGIIETSLPFLRTFRIFLKSRVIGIGRVKLVE
jgi:hypothetical protein